MSNTNTTHASTSHAGGSTNGGAGGSGNPNNLQVARIKPEQSKVAKQNVRPFLNKLATMVSDPETDDLIRWSEDGESFYVPNHERFGRELLPKFFKHGNFSSFVRQLNMYGFHKVPHLQQGVLKNETDTELWQFSNPNFKRDLPDLLPLIGRKKGTMAGFDEDDPASKMNGARVGAGLDLRTIATGIASIKRHQNAISSELKELQTSNSALWQEALAARERHQQHQETINKILRFLAGVFGAGAAGGVPGMMGRTGSPMDEGEQSREGEMVPRKKPRLMLAAAGQASSTAGKGKRKSRDEPDEYVAQDGGYFENRFSEVTPSEQAPTPPAISTAQSTPATGMQPMSSSSSSLSPTSLTRTRTPGPAGPADPGVFASTLQALLNSPNSAQRLLASLATMPPGGGVPSVPGVNMPAAVAPYPGMSGWGMPLGQDGQLAPYAGAPPGQQQPQQPASYPFQYPANFDFSSLSAQLPQPLPPAAPAASSSTGSSSNQPQQPFGPPPTASSTLYHPQQDQSGMLQSVAENAAGLQRAYRDTEAINADVDALQESINSLIHSLGIDPNQLGPAAAAGTEPAAEQEQEPAQPLPPPEDFDIDAFLSSLNATGGGLEGALDPLEGGIEVPPGPGSTPTPGPGSYDAFFDEMSSQGTASPPPPPPVQQPAPPQHAQAGKGVKRKAGGR